MLSPSDASLTGQEPAFTGAHRIREYDAGDEQAVVQLWNRCLQRDEISLNTFRRKIVLDPNFEAPGCAVAECDGTVMGFLLSLRRRYPYYDLGLEPGKGWISVFFVDPACRRKGIATGLLDRAEAFLKERSVTHISVSDYTPNYFSPGIDMDAYPEALKFLQHHGYHKAGSVYGMGRSIVDFDIPPEMQERMHRLERSGFSVEVFKPCHMLKVLEFLRLNYPGDLFRVAHDRLIENPECDEILVAIKDGTVVGFSHFQDERFGPFGIAREYVGRGLGPFLYYRTVDQMRKKGRRNLWLAWTTGRAKDFYYKMGLKVVRRHAIMQKDFNAPQRKEFRS